MSDPSLAAVLRAKGLRLTAQRQLVLEAVHELGHATPDQVHAKVAEVAAGVNITTVYRTLELLEELGLVTHAHLSHGAPTFHPVGEALHVHLVCQACGQVSELPSGFLAPLAQSLERERGFLLDIGHVALFGVCAGCGDNRGFGEHRGVGEVQHHG